LVAAVGTAVLAFAGPAHADTIDWLKVPTSDASTIDWLSTPSAAGDRDKAPARTGLEETTIDWL
jgi:hypothetical protein